MTRRLVLFFTCFFFLLFVHAQQDKGSIQFSPHVSLSAFTANSNKLNGSVLGGEIMYQLPANPARPWMQHLKLSSIDFVFKYQNMSGIKVNDNQLPKQFGDSYTIMSALSLPLIRGKNTGLYFSPGFGFTYTGETWFTNENPVIGSHLNFALSSSLKIIRSIGPTTGLALGLDFFHYSNAGFIVPNNGMNTNNLSLGILRHLGSQPKTISSVDEKTFFESRYKKHSFDLGYNIGRRSVYRSKQGLYKSGWYAGYNYRFHPILGMSTGIDAIRYHSVYDPERAGETYQSYATSLEPWRVGLAVGPDIWLGRMGIMLKLGYYLYYESLEPVNTYWTAGVKYHIFDWAAIQAKTYIHKTQVDYMGFGVILTR